MKYLQYIPKTVFLILIVSITMVLVSCASKHEKVQSDTANLTEQQKAIAELKKLGGDVSISDTTVNLRFSRVTDAALVHLKELNEFME